MEQFWHIVMAASIPGIALAIALRFVDDRERQRRLARLVHLGIPQAVHAGIAERSPPRGHSLIHAAIVLGSIGLAVLALIAWSRFVAAIAERAAQTVCAQMYDSDLGLESLGGLFTVLLAAGWLCGWLTRRRGSEAARNAMAFDLMHEPAKNKAVTDFGAGWLRAASQPETATIFLTSWPALSCAI
jgi:hypothetical protein